MILYTIITLPLVYAWALTALALILALITVLWFMRPMITVGNHHAPEEQPPFDKAPKVSVIVCTGSREEELINHLDALTQQDYPDYEIIVVCDTTSESSEILAESCAHRYGNVYVTFIPPGSHNLSRRKLALTLGMKAAKGDVVVTTVSTATIPSAQWLSALTAPFRGPRRKDIEISLGYSHQDYAQMKGLNRWYREFDSLMTDSRWLGYALAHDPYRGDGFNLAISKDLFFRHKGYSRSIGLQAGDDDIFIHEVATPQNTEAVLSPDSILRIEWGDASSRIWKARKEQYDFTSHWLPQTPFTLAGAFSAMQWIIPALCVAAAVIAYIFRFDDFAADHSLMLELLAVIPVALLVYGGFLLAETLIYRRCASRMQATRLWWALPWFMLLRPLNNIIFRLFHRGSQNSTMI
ncbi:MAG: glycosyltransferase [Muribaculaceae bacterium]|nr:glycosyltransferase [Muribaculaceae bacterium]